jgi:uridine kinase
MTANANASHITHITKRNGRIVVFNEQRIADAIFKAARALGGEDVETARLLAATIGKRLNDSFEEGARPTVEEIQDFVVDTLQREGHDSTALAYQRYRVEHARLRRRREREPDAAPIPYKILWEVFTWNVDFGCDHVDHLNEHVRRGTLPIIIKEAEKIYHAEVAKLAEVVLDRRDSVRLVIIAGPSSSGKTTTTIKLGERLAKHGLQLVTLNLDNYFHDLETHPKDEFGDYDFERPEALDIPLINEHLAGLIAGETIQTPIYDFKTGKRTAQTVPMKIDDNQIILLDSLHGLYDPLTASVPAERKFRMYIEAMCQVKNTAGEFVRWADLRMLRRMVRDSWHRSYTPIRTVGHWHYVRRSELEYIVPYIHKADFVFNGSLPYELPVLKKYMWPYMDEILNAYKDDPKRYDAAIRARRVYDLLRSLLSIEDETAIPTNSLMREYIGGSEYEY